MKRSKAKKFNNTRKSKEKEVKEINLKNVVVSYNIHKTIEIDFSKLSPSAKKFIKTSFKDEDDRTDEEWDIMESYDWYDVIGEVTGEDESLMSEIEVENFW